MIKTKYKIEARFEHFMHEAFQEGLLVMPEHVRNTIRTAYYQGLQDFISMYMGAQKDPELSKASDFFKMIFSQLSDYMNENKNVNPKDN